MSHNWLCKVLNGTHKGQMQDPLRDLGRQFCRENISLAGGVVRKRSGKTTITCPLQSKVLCRKWQTRQIVERQQPAACLIDHAQKFGTFGAPLDDFRRLNSCTSSGQVPHAR